MDSARGFWARNYLIILLVIAIAVILVVGLSGQIMLPFRWLAIIAVMSAFLVAIGKDKTVREYADAGGVKRKTAGRFDGILIDDRNKMSLSRLQIILWTLVALSTWGALVLHRTIPLLTHTVTQLPAPLAKSIRAEMAKYGIQDARVDALYTLLTGQEKLPADTDTAPTNFEPLKVKFPNELLLAMGISTTSLALSAVIKTDKSRTQSGRALELYRNEKDLANEAFIAAKNAENQINKQIGEIQAKLTAEQDPAKRAGYEAQLKTLASDQALAHEEAEAKRVKYEELAETERSRMGILHTNEKVEDAKWSDLFSGDKIQDFQHVDIAKVQMFFFTFIIVFSYLALVWAQMSEAGAQRLLEVLPQVSLPAFSDSLVALLGLSHAGYLTVKAAG
jgi:hypothetical protein